MRILVVEDEPKTAAYLNKGLSEAGYHVDVAKDGQAGLQLAIRNSYDLFLFDVMLPLRDGWSLVRELRASDVQTPIMLLTARDTVPDRVKGLELGADDYLVKPFAFSELLARVRSLCRRTAAQVTDDIRIADLVIELSRHRVTRAGSRIDLTPREFALLSLLARRQSEVLSRTLLAEQVWEINFYLDTNVVDVAIRRLRKKIDDRYAKPLIHTVRGVGYVLEDRS